MAESVPLTQLKRGISSKSGLARSAAQAQALAPKMELKSKWTAIFEEFLMVRFNSRYGMLM
jgi:hypothetical protein